MEILERAYESQLEQRGERSNCRGWVDADPGFDPTPNRAHGKRDLVPIEE